MPVSDMGLSMNAGKSDKNILKRVGLKEHPCLTPLLGEIFFPILHWVVLLWSYYLDKSV
jgi:hypothetical protein